MLAESDHRPFLPTTVARLMLSRMRMTHEETGIAVISGPWGIGKTTAIDAFAAEFEDQCAIIKVEPGTTRRGASGGKVMQGVVEALRALNGKPLGTQLSNATWTLRQMIHANLSELFDPDCIQPRFSLIFDEAQNLSREAIDILRFWNDRDRTTTPFPVGLIFVGNNEFAMAESLGGESVLSGAVRSRLLFEEQLTYAHVNEADLRLFAQANGLSDHSALNDFVEFFNHSRVKPNLHIAATKLKICRRFAGDEPISHSIVRKVLYGD